MGWKESVKSTIDATWQWTDKHIGEPSTRLSHRMGMEGFWPTELGKECDKAARIIMSFTKDQGDDEQAVEEVAANTNMITKPKGKQRKQLIKIPPSAIEQAKGIAVFTVMRTGLVWSGAGGSGIVIARNEKGEFGGPSGIMMHTMGWGLLAGVDVYDVVLILRTDSAVRSFAHPKVTMGGEISAAAGPIGMGGMLDASVNQSPCWSYTRSKGFYAGIQLDGSIVLERSDENERFYGHAIKAIDILTGHSIVPEGARGLVETLKLAQGRTDVDRSRIPGGKPPSDHVLSKSEREASGMAEPLGGYATNLDGRLIETGLTPDIKDVTEVASGVPPTLPARREGQYSNVGENPFDMKEAPAFPAPEIGDGTQPPLPPKGEYLPDGVSSSGSYEGDRSSTSRQNGPPILPARDPGRLHNEQSKSETQARTAPVLPQRTHPGAGMISDSPGDDDMADVDLDGGESGLAQSVRSSVGPGTVRQTRTRTADLDKLLDEEQNSGFSIGEDLGEEARNREETDLT